MVLQSSLFPVQHFIQPTYSTLTKVQYSPNIAEEIWPYTYTTRATSHMLKKIHLEMGQWQEFIDLQSFLVQCRNKNATI